MGHSADCGKGQEFRAFQKSGRISLVDLRQAREQEGS